MGFYSQQTVVGTTSVALMAYTNNEGTATDPVPMIVQVPTGATQTVFVGGSGVTTGSGYALIPGNEYTFRMIGGEVLFGVVGSNTQLVYTLGGRH